MSHHQKYNICKAYLEEELFKVVPPKLKDVHWPVINITVLPDYLAYIKSLMLEEERILLSQYNVQTFLIEGAFTFSPNKTFDQLTSDILKQIRSSNKFWLRKMGAEEQKLNRHHAIEQYLKNLNGLEEEFKTKPYQQEQFRITNNKKINQVYEYYGNLAIKGAHKFTVNIFPTATNFVIQKLANIAIDQEFQKKIIFQLIINFALSSKPKPKQVYMGVILPTNQEFEGTKKGESMLEKLEQWLENNGEYEKYFNSQKEYYLIGNILRMCQHYYKIKQQNQIMDASVDQFEQLRADCANRMFTELEISTLAHYFKNKFRTYLQKLLIQRETKQCEDEEKWRGFISTPLQIEEAFNMYEQIISHPENTNQTKYKVTDSKVPWSDDEYKQFLICFKEFFNVPTNNKRIAVSMGKNIESSHVKYVKGIYMRNMGNRIDMGEIGGGKRGVFDSKFNFLERDIDNFNMRWFKKDKKTKSKKTKKRRKKPNFDGEEEDSDY